MATFADGNKPGKMTPMPDAPRPSRPLSPWPVGAALLGVFVALSIFLGGSYAALQVMFGIALLAGLAATWNRTRRQPAGRPPDPVDAEQAARTKGSVPDPTNAELPPVATADEVGNYLRVDVTDVIRDLEAGRLPGNRVGPHWRIRREALIAWLDRAHSSSA